MTFDNWLELIRVSALLLSSVAIPMVIFILGNRYTKIRQLEEKLRNDRIEIYNKILEPFLLIFSTEAIIKGSSKYKRDQEKTGVQLAAEKMLNLDYQDYAFKLNLIGSDKVVKAYNNLMQAYYNLPKNDENGQELIKYMSVLLLEVRKSLGNESTKLHAIEMLEWKISDLRKQKINGKYPNMRKYYL